MVVFGGDENVSVKRGNFIAPSVRVGLAVLMHRRWYWLIEERQLVVLDVDNLKLCVLAAFQDIVHPLCDGRGFTSRPGTADDDSNFQHFPLPPFWCGPQGGANKLDIKIDAETCFEDTSF